MYHTSGELLTRVEALLHRPHLRAAEGVGEPPNDARTAEEGARLGVPRRRGRHADAQVHVRAAEAQPRARRPKHPHGREPKVRAADAPNGGEERGLGLPVRRRGPHRRVHRGDRLVQQLQQRHRHGRRHRRRRQWLGRAGGHPLEPPGAGAGATAPSRAGRGTARAARHPPLAAARRGAAPAAARRGSRGCLPTNASHWRRHRDRAAAAPAAIGHPRRHWPVGSGHSGHARKRGTRDGRACRRGDRGGRGKQRRRRRSRRGRERQGRHSLDWWWRRQTGDGR